MPRYFFHIVHADERQNDPVGVDLPGDQSAFDHAVDMLRRLLRTPSGQRLSLLDGGDGRSWPLPLLRSA
jgi:hypothetical protein